MRRVLMGLVWFLVLAVVLFLVLQILITLFIILQAPKGVDQAAVLKSASDFADSHAGTIRLLDSMTLITAVLLAGFGTLKGVLPGTHRQD
jgi:preprotein translocase subunit SecG